MDQTVVSVVLPVYNGAAYIADAVRSILSQSFVDFELILINDGSKDNTLEIINEFTADPRVVLISRENKGLIYSLNEGIAKASGRYIARMDADDYSYPNRLADQVKLMEAGALDICGGHYMIIGSTDKFLGSVFLPLDAVAFQLYLSIMPPFAHGSVMFRKAFWDNQGMKYGSNYKEAEDFALWQEFYFNGARFGNVNEVIFKYRDHPASFSYVKARAMQDEARVLRRRFIKESGIDFRQVYEQMLARPELSAQEKEFILLSAYLNFKVKGDRRFFGLLRKFNFEITLRALAKILNGRI